MHNYSALVAALSGETSDEFDGSVGTRRHFAEHDSDDAEREIEWTPELMLMTAILEDAVACYCRTLKRPRQNPEILARQAEFWMRLDDWESPFSFNNICEALNLDPAAARKRILASKPGLKS